MKHRHFQVRFFQEEKQVPTVFKELAQDLFLQYSIVILLMKSSPLKMMKLIKWEQKFADLKVSFAEFQLALHCVLHLNLGKIRKIRVK